MPRKSAKTPKSVLEKVTQEVSKEVQDLLDSRGVPQFKEEEFPADVQEAMRVLSGGTPKSFAAEFSPNLDGYPQLKGAAFGGASAQEEFIKKKDPVEIKIRFEDNQCYVVDLTTATGQATYATVMNLIGDPESGVVLAEQPKDPQILIDNNGVVHAMMVIKTSRPKEYIKKTGPGYEVVDSNNPKDNEGLDEPQQNT